MTDGVLVAGIGNVFLSDDGFGVAVANRLAATSLPPGVRVADFGIRGVHLAYELLDGIEGLIIVDAVPMGEAPGTVAIIEPELNGTLDVDDDSQVVDAHSMSPEMVLGMLTRLGGKVDHVYVVGCQPGCLEEGMGLSLPVEGALDDAVALCRQLAAEVVQLVGKETVG